MNDDPLTRSDETDNGDLPGPAAPVVRRESADPDLPKTAREVATSIGALITEVRQLNTRLEENAEAAELLDTRMSKGERALRRTTIALVLIAVIGMLGGLLTYQVFETTQCQGHVNQVTRDVLTKRGEAFDKQTAALEALASGVIDPAATPEQRRATLVEFRDGMRAAKQQRAENPFPTWSCS